RREGAEHRQPVDCPSRAMKESEMTTHRMAAIAGLVALLAITVALAGCSNDPAPGAESAPPAAAGSGTAGDAPAMGPDDGKEAFELTPALLQAYAKGLRKEVEIIRRPGRGTHYGVKVSKFGEEGPEVAAAAGLSIEEYQAVQEVVGRIFTTLNFQGKIGPPRSIDLAEADPVWKARLEGDPFDELSPSSARALRDHMDVLVPPWSEIVGMTAQND